MPKAGEPILSRLLRDFVLAKPVVERMDLFSCFQYTFEVVGHEVSNIRLGQIYGHSTVVIPYYSHSIKYIHI